MLIKMRGIFILFIIVFSMGFVSAVASFQVTSFSCSPSEVVVGNLFSCIASVKNVGDVAGSVSTITLFREGSWLESSIYAQAYGSSVDVGNSFEVNFGGLRAVSGGSNNGFSKITLDSVSDFYVADVKVNTIDVAVNAEDSTSSAAMGGSIVTSVEATTYGSVNLVLVWASTSGGCNLGTQNSTQVVSGMGDGSKVSRTWTITQGTSGACGYTISASAIGTSGVASKIDSVSNTISCTDCPVDSGSDSGSGSGSGGSGGISGVSELSVSQKELSQGDSFRFNVSGIGHSLILVNLSNSAVTIYVESERQVFVLSVGDSVSVDLDGDGSSEISISLKSINILTKKATFIITKLKDATIVPSNLTRADVSESNNGSESGVGNGIKNIVKSISLTGVIITLLVLAIIGLLVWYLLKEKRPNKYIQIKVKK